MHSGVALQSYVYLVWIPAPSHPGRVWPTPYTLVVKKEFKQFTLRTNRNHIIFTQHYVRPDSLFFPRPRFTATPTTIISKEKRRVWLSCETTIASAQVEEAMYMEAW